MGAHLLEQVSDLFRRQRLDEILLARGQDALEADREKIIIQKRMIILLLFPPGLKQ